jgi:hypothetical protein
MRAALGAAPSFDEAVGDDREAADYDKADILGDQRCDGNVELRIEGGHPLARRLAAVPRLGPTDAVRA